MKQETYTQEEVKSNINTLDRSLTELISKRKQLNEDIKNVTIQIKYWEELDLSQYKLFNK